MKNGLLRVFPRPEYHSFDDFQNARMERKMLGSTRCTLWLVALIGIACSVSAGASPRIDPDPAWRNSGNISELTAVLDLWLDENTDFEPPGIGPKVRVVSQSMATSLRGVSGSSHGRTRGLFDPQSSTIYLIQPWNPKNAHDVSVLLHELVHSRQVSRYYYCPGAQEEAAYRLQDAWLRERGLKANVNWIAVVLQSGCTPRDIHPD